RWSSRSGLSFAGGGSAALETRIPVRRSLGGVLALEELYLGVAASTTDPGASLVAAVSGSVRIGPLVATLDRVGVRAELIPVPEDRPPGVLGRVDFRFGFKGPSGVGLALEAGPVTGGGYLLADPDHGRYAGALELSFGAVALAAVGLLDTRLPDGSPIRMPDGRPGFSLLIIISADFPPVQLGFGFTLNGVGGLVGIHRGARVEALQAGLRGGSLDSVLFPRDVVRNAPRIVAELSRVFPVAEGRYLVGPMARLGWGTPPLVTLELALVLEIPAPVRLLVLGRMRLAVPRPEQALVLLQLDVLGVVDFGKGELAVDATLRESRIATFPVTGDMAVRARWSGRPLLIAAAGGFNPRFPAPEGFPALQRLAIHLSSGSNPRLRLEAYLALTSNTLQFGARLDAYFAADLGIIGKFSVEAVLAFDALIQYDPFSFVVDIHAQASLRRNGKVLMGVELDLELSGPRPWFASGVATFHFLGKRSIRFSRRFGPAGQAPRLPSVPPAEVLQRVVGALADGRNWSADLPARAE
ncbi:MAG TPA: DUF6603 domain-containing protein, partial [Longimicrobiaceae bacterium]|nr:DUF6603 domain-containing protein [Longimicrobiaceae bacterium]